MLLEKKKYNATTWLALINGLDNLAVSRLIQGSSPLLKVKI